jgi:hypothetical protein
MAILYFLFFLNLLWLGFITTSLYRNKNKQKNQSIGENFNDIKINILRFNPFENMGGDQSFILTILNHNNDGVVVTSLHNRDLTRIYAKPIKNGEGNNITLSKEEKLAIVKTIKG